MRNGSGRFRSSVVAASVATLLAAAALLLGPARASAQPVCGERYVIAPGDTLYSLAGRCDTSVAAILAANPSIADPNRIPVGLQIELPGAGMGTGAEETYTVRPGDTLYSIARQFETTVSALVAANPVIDDPNRIRIGQQLDLPGDAATGPPIFTAVEIPLIAQGSGDLGCGDSVVFVERSVEPTQAPLLATLETLLAVDEEAVGPSGLYNPLARSDLRLTDLDLQDRRATIRLAGDFRIGGVCDGPRVAAQLRQSALQYGTVDAVDVFVNGEPLDQFLSGR